MGSVGDRVLVLLALGLLKPVGCPAVRVSGCLAFAL